MTTIATTKVHTAKQVDLTGKRLFFQLVHYARELRGKNHFIRRALVVGYARCITVNREDYSIADYQRDFWKCQGCGERI